jgi:hypothetical protein
MEEEMRKCLQVTTKQKHEATYWPSEATAAKPSSSELTTASGLMAFLRGLRRDIMERTQKGGGEGQLVRTWRWKRTLYNFLAYLNGHK